MESGNKMKIKYIFPYSTRFTETPPLPNEAYAYCSIRSAFRETVVAFAAHLVGMLTVLKEPA